MRGALMLVPLLAILGASPLAKAQEKPSKPSAALIKEMKARLAEGKKLLEEGFYEKALALFQEGYASYQEPDFLLFTGYSLLKLRRYEEAQKTFEEYLAKNPKTKQKKELQKIIEEIPAILETTISVTTVPEGATLWLDTQVEAPFGTAPAEGKVTPGPHILIAQKPGYAVSYERIEAKRGETTKITLTLKEAPSPLHLETEPAGAEVFLDGTKVGKTPYKGEVAPGSHTIEARLPGYGTLSLNVTARLGEPISLSEKMPPPSGALVLTGKFPGAEVLLDGKPAGQALPLRLEVPEGEYDLTIKAPGFRSLETRITISAEQETTLPITLQPAGMYLTVESNVEDTKIRLNGETIPPGGAPLFLARGGKYKVEVTKKGFLPFREVVKVKEDGDFALKVMLKEPKPRSGLLPLGASLAAGAVGGFCGVKALLNNQKFQRQPTPELREETLKQALCANVGLGISGVAAVSALALFQSWGKRSPGEILPVLSPEGAGVSVQMPF